MMRTALLAPAALAAVLLLSGCTGGDDPARSTSTPGSTSVVEPSTTPTDDIEVPEVTPTPDSASYPTATDLQAAAVAAGLDCDDAPDTKAVAPALSAVTCGDLTLTVYATAADRDSIVNAALADEGSTQVFLVGANWLITAPDSDDTTGLADLIPGLGGFIVPQGS
ncbi:hypothetical protein QT381_04035 [Galbitalea sp. SE-J8]|uniref:hypothetical protein n=1 Tax=Galbitalea sp. SE-J8 TaxID=3054952 RepID=UPI00259CF132|nr:hypothetical protein [Galbitalea sp. SE-J8]MDM4762174.1 hypothetical protein [Galbitalea sp. SE-J8]